MSIPQVSVDRAVGHYVEEFHFDPDATQRYYESLPHPDKKPLEECRIHFSALAPYDGAVVGKGVHLADPERSKILDPQAPPANIVIFIGSHVEKSFVDLDETVKHELAHYAQNNPLERKIDENELLLRAQLALNRGKTAKAFWLAKAAIYGGLFEAATAAVDEAPDIKWAAVYGLGTAALGSLVYRKRKRKRIYSIEEKLHALQTEAEIEKDATLHANVEEPLVGVVSRQTNAPILARKRRGGSIGNKLIDFAHKDLSLTPPLPNKD